MHFGEEKRILILLYKRAPFSLSSDLQGFHIYWQLAMLVSASASASYLRRTRNWDSFIDKQSAQIVITVISLASLATIGFYDKSPKVFWNAIFGF